MTFVARELHRLPSPDPDEPAQPRVGADRRHAAGALPACCSARCSSRSSARSASAPTTPYTFLVPGLLVQLGMFGAFFAGFGLIGEWREGVIEAERVTPASRTALLVGRLMRDVLQLLVQALILVGLGYADGHARLVRRRRRSASLITLLVGGACAAASNALALTTKSEDVMAPVINMVMMPVLLLSGILLPMTLGPEWLQRLSDFMPFRWIVDAVRDSFVGDFATIGRALGHRAGPLVLFAAGALVGHRDVPQGERLNRRRGGEEESDVQGTK